MESDVNVSSNMEEASIAINLNKIVTSSTLVDGDPILNPTLLQTALVESSSNLEALPVTINYGNATICK